MLIKIGTANTVKIEAVKEVFADYSNLATEEIIGVDVSSGVRPQPLTMKETVQGALNRALNALADADIGVGIESGLMQTSFGWFCFTSAIICDDKTNLNQDRLNLLDTFSKSSYKRGIYAGYSTAFSLPDTIIDCLHFKNMELDQAAYHCGLTNVVDIGKKDGLLSTLTKGRVTRKLYIKQALIMALIPWENKEIYC